MDRVVCEILTSNVSPHYKALFAGTLWAIWKQRNSLIFKGQQPQPKNVINEAEHAYLTFSKWSTTTGSKSRNPEPQQERWTPPKQGTLKINLDAAWSSAKKEGSAAAVCRNAQGCLIDGFAGKINAPFAYMAEALTLRCSLLWIRDRQQPQLSQTPEVPAAVSEVIVASDCQAVVSHVLGLETIPWASRSVIADCKSLLAQLGNVHLIYEPRSTNRAADWVAKAHHTRSLPSNWVTRPPPSLVSVLCHEFHPECNQATAQL
ncbi:hypothetical protein BT93_C2390 [Corymbia citriodora subsp. variegata]|nr:hypothetical protein BT93_C2390 [Corymbia citriodora subsp. variegata]